MNRHLTVFALACSLVACGLAAAQNVHHEDAAGDRIAAADAAYQSKDWAKAESLYDQLVQAQPENPRYQYRLGVCRQGLGKHQAAIDAFQKSQSLGVPPQIVLYNLAVVYASMGQTGQALEQLASAVKAGYSQPDQLSSDPDLQPIHQDSRFSALVEQSKRNQKPCAYSTESRQFDFWVGDWDVVVTSAGSPAGRSHIERAIGDCVIWENWSGNSGHFGKSYNVYNANLKRWEQFWVDDTGGMIHFYGGLKDGVMDFYTDDIPQPDGTTWKRHLQFFNLGPDTVRQFSQGSKDSGKTWSVEYDLTYNRTK